MDFLLSLITQLLDFLRHVPEHLQLWSLQYGRGLYAILAFIVFAETGLIVTPFLPGDSLLFATGALLAYNMPGLDLPTMCVLLTLAAFFGDMVNYHMGKLLGPRFLNPKHLQKTNEFYAKYGGKTIILARFVPIIRTYAPFVAGMGAMKYSVFFIYNIAGGALWVVSFLCLGYFFGNIPAVKTNFELVILGIIALSLLPVVIEFWRERRKMP
jgi:membrane-associated protein